MGDGGDGVGWGRNGAESRPSCSIMRRLHPTVCLASCRAMTAYHSAMVELSDRLLDLLEISLDLPPGWFDDKFNESLVTLQPLHYR